MSAPDYADLLADDCGHGVSYDDDCEACDAQGVMAEAAGARTPNEIGIARRAYEAGRLSVTARVEAALERPDWRRALDLQGAVRESLKPPS